MSQNNLTKKISIAILLIGVSLALQFSTSNITDPDSFYHMAHAKIYAEHGIFYNEFPWVQFSIIKDYQSNIWYGFQLLVIPLTYIKDQIWAIKIGGAFITLTTLSLFFWAMARLKIKWPLIWTLMLAAAAPDLMYRLTMLRPHNLSFSLSVLIFSFTVIGGAGTILILSALVAWLHLALVWLPFLVVLTTILAKKMQGQQFEWKKILAVSGGIILGWLLRPHPWGAAKIVYVQVVDFLIIKLNKIPLQFGRELKSLGLSDFNQQLLPTLLVLIPAVIFFFSYLNKKISRLPKDQNFLTILGSSLSVTAVFFFLTIFVARRGYDSFLGYSVITIGLITTAYINFKDHLYSQNKNYSRHPKNTQTIVVALALAVIMIMSANALPLFKHYNAQAWSPQYLKEVSLWLRDNTQPGDIVFNTRWDYFAPLFFWNQKNYYINGMDPLFQYKYNSSLYWKTHFLAIDAADKYTCGKIKCTKEEIEETHRVLVNDFHAKYLMLRQAQNPKLYFYLIRDKKFPLVFENKNEAVFKIPPLENK